MRPKRNLVLYSYDLDWADSVRMAIETRLYVNCSETDDPEVVTALARSGKCDGVALLGVWTTTQGILDQLPVAMPSLLIMRGKESFNITTQSTATFHWNNQCGDMLELLTAIRVLLAHKRGPKKKLEVTAP